jgi:hypothetical protein
MKKLLISLAPALVVAMFAFAPSAALATEHHPTGNFAPFKFCPLANSEVTSCTIAESKSGEFTVGNRSVPINKTITIQGGLSENNAGELTFFGAEGAETLAKVPLFVPGGLFNIVAPEKLNKEQKERFEKFVNEGITGVTATTELAGPPSAIKLNLDNLLFEEGTALQLPIKVKLGNAFLGSACYVGSEAHPIILNLTTGTTSPAAPNKPIKGAVGTFEDLEGGALTRLIGGSLVDNTWAAPGASGCGGKALEGIIDGAVNSELGLPAAAGHNTAILNGNLELAAAAAVKASE